MKRKESLHRARKIFVDTNVILDFFLEREGFYYDALKIWSACEEGRVEGYVSALTVSTVHYVARKLKSETTAMIAVRGLLEVFKVVPLDATILRLAADFHDRDYEDDVQLQSAISVGCTHLFTRDATHYHSKAIAILPPASFAVPSV